MAGQVGGRIRAWAAWLVLAVAAASLLARTEFKASTRMYDFAIEYAAASAWTHGQDAYDIPALSDLWRNAGGARGVTQMPAFQSSNLPPSTLVVLSPMTVLPSWWAAEIWMAMAIAVTVAAALAAGDLAGLFEPGASPRTSVPLLLAAVLASGPVQSGILVGQVAIPACCLAVLGVWCDAKRRRPVLAGVLIGLAAALKPPVAVAFIAYYLWRRAWTVGAIAAVLLAACGVIGVARLYFGGTPWLTHWLGNMAAGFVPGAVNDYGIGNPTRDHLVNVQTLLDWPLGGNRPLITAAAALITLALATVWLALSLRRANRTGPTELLALTTIISIALLPVYHRYYDLTATLTLTAAWAIAEWRGPLRRLARAALVLMIPLLLPVGWQTNLLNRGRLPRWIGETGWWHGLAEPLYAGVLLMLCAWLLLAMAASLRARTAAVTAAGAVS